MNISFANVKTIYVHNPGKVIVPKDKTHINKILKENKHSTVSFIYTDYKTKIIQIGYVEDDFTYSS